jgi:anthranilate/para-aminobenzoate synthase component I
VLADAIVRQLPGNTPFLCYGTAESTLVALGRQASLSVPRKPGLDSQWRAVDQFIRSHEGAPIAGFIGFDPANQMGFEVAEYRQKVDLFVPETLVACSRQGWRVQFGEDIAPALPARAGEAPPRPLDSAHFDSEPNRSGYRDAVARVLDCIHSGSLERATLARRIDVNLPLDLGATFLSEGCAHRCSRNFYFANSCIRFAGQSPEVLAEGDSGRFTTNKLSGTCHRDTAVPVQQLQRRFQSDERIRAEHASSIGTIDKALRGLGKVEVERFKVMRLPSLLHGWSEFTTWPGQPGNIADCLRAVFPFGVKPLDRGLRLLRENENFMRGPYYGLEGCIEPDGRFSFTQVLRAAFADRRGYYLVAGAAITAHSTPQHEMEETCDKLSSIDLFQSRAEG